MCNDRDLVMWSCDSGLTFKSLMAGWRNRAVSQRLKKWGAQAVKGARGCTEQRAALKWGQRWPVGKPGMIFRCTQESGGCTAWFDTVTRATLVGWVVKRRPTGLGWPGTEDAPAHG